MNMVDLKVIRPVDEDVVRFAERMLDLAKKGELRSIICINEYDDGSVNPSWAFSKHAQKFRMLGALHVFAHKLAKDLA